MAFSTSLLRRHVGGSSEQLALDSHGDLARLAPGQSADEAFAHLEGLIQAALPFGLASELTRNVSSEGWSYEAEGPAFDAAERAYAKAFGADLVRIGVGGSIPFITMFANRFPETPLILNGVMDPRTSAHGPNESLHVGLFEKVVLANVFLFQELAEALSQDAKAAEPAEAAAPAEAEGEAVTAEGEAVTAEGEAVTAEGEAVTAAAPPADTPGEGAPSAGAPGEEAPGADALEPAE